MAGEVSTRETSSVKHHRENNVWTNKDTDYFIHRRQDCSRTLSFV